MSYHILRVPRAGSSLRAIPSGLPPSPPSSAPKSEEYNYLVTAYTSIVLHGIAKKVSLRGGTLPARIASHSWCLAYEARPLTARPISPLPAHRRNVHSVQVCLSCQVEFSTVAFECPDEKRGTTPCSSFGLQSTCICSKCHRGGDKQPERGFYTQITWEMWRLQGSFLGLSQEIPISTRPAESHYPGMGRLTQDRKHPGTNFDPVSRLFFILPSAEHRQSGFADANSAIPVNKVACKSKLIYTR